MRKAFVLATALHVAVLALALRRSAVRPVPPPPEPALELGTVVEEVPIEPAPSADPESLAAAAASSHPPHGGANAGARTSEGARSAEPGAEGTNAVVESESGSWSFNPLKSGPVELVPSLRSLASRGAPVSDGHKEAPPSSLRQALHGEDVKKGHAVGAPLLEVARGVSLHELAAASGTTTFEAEIDATGRVVAVRIVSSNGDRREWNWVKDGILEAMRKKPVTLPAGCEGALVVFTVESRWQYPSGAKGALTGPKVSQTPDGLPGLSVGFDLSDIGTKPTRMISARIVDEYLR